MLIGETATRICRLLQKMDRVAAGNQFAKVAIEVACYDLLEGVMDSDRFSKNSGSLLI